MVFDKVVVILQHEKTRPSIRILKLENIYASTETQENLTRQLLVNRGKTSLINDLEILTYQECLFPINQPS